MREDRAMMNQPTRSRRNLFATTALAAALVHVPLMAATLPVGGLVGGTAATVSNVSTTVAAGGQATSLGGATGSSLSADPTQAAVTFTVNTDKSVVEWSEFNIGAGKTVSFANGTSNANFSVLNRVTGTTGSDIRGTLDGGGGSIWLINENGIGLVGGTVTNVAGFVASTLNVTDGDFLTQPSTGYRFVCSIVAACATPQSLTIDGTSTITTSGPMVLVAPKLTTAGTLASVGDVALVVAADARVQLAGNSIIGVSIAAGTTVGNTTDALSVSGGAITGSSVYAVAVTPAAVLNTLLRIDGTITATATATGIVLTSGTTAANVTVDGGLGGGAAVVSSTIASSGNYSVTGTTVTLGAAGATAAAPVSQSAVGDIVIRSTAGDIAALGTTPNALALLSNSAGTGNPRLILDSAAAITGKPKLTGGTAAQRSYVNLRLNDPTKAIDLGDITGAGFGSADYVIASTPSAGYSFQTALTTAGAITAGTIVTSQALTVHSTGNDVAIGSANSLDTIVGAVDIESDTGAVTLGSASSGNLDVRIVAAAGASVTGGVTSARDYFVSGSSVTLANDGATQSAVGDILIQSAGNIFASGTLVADSIGAGNKRLVLDASAGGLFNSAAGPVNLIAGSGAPATAANRSDILLSFALAHNLTLGAVDADVFSTATHGAAPTTVADYSPDVQAVTLVPTLVIDGAITTGAIDTVQSTIIGSTGALAGARDVSIGGIASSTGSVEVFATNGDVTLTAPVAAATSAYLHADAGATSAGDISALNGNVTVEAATLATVSGTVTATADYIVTGDNVRLGTVVASTQAAAGAVSITATTRIVGQSGLTLQSNSDGTTGATAEAITLTAGAAAPLLPADRSIDFASGSRLIGGSVANRESDVLIVQNANARGLRLGDVDARGLLGSPVVADALLTVAGGGDLDAGTITVSEQLNLATTGTGAATLTAANVLGRGASVTPGFTGTDDNLLITADTVNITTVRNFSSDASGGDIVLTGAHGVTVGDARAARDLTISAVSGNVAATTLRTGRDLTLGAASIGAPTPAALRAGRSITAISTAGDVRIDSATTTGVTLLADLSGDSLVPTAGNGSIIASATGGLTDGDAEVTTFDVVGSTGDLLVSATGNATAGTGNGQANIAGRDISLTAGVNKTATLGSGTAGRDVTLSGGTVQVITQAQAGDDIVAVASTGSVAATQLTATGLGPDSEASSEVMPTVGVTGLAVSNIVVEAATTATVSGLVSSARDYRVTGTSVTLGSASLVAPVTQSAGGKVVITATSGSANLLLGVDGGAAGDLISNFSGASALTAGSLTVTAATLVDGATTRLTARRIIPLTIQAQQPGVTVAVAAAGSNLTLASVNGGTVDIGAPGVISVPFITASGNVNVLGVPVVANTNDTAMILPTIVTIDATGVMTPPAANVTLSAGSGVTATTAVVGTGTFNELKLLSDTGLAQLTETPAVLTATASILVESQTGTARIVTANAGTITVAGRQAGSIAEVTGEAHAATALTLTGPIAQIHNSAGSAQGTVDAGNLIVAGIASATLDNGGTPGGSIDVSAFGSAAIGSATAAGHVVGVGDGVTVSDAATGDDVALVGNSTSASVTVNSGATITAGGSGTSDLQAGDDAQTITYATLVGAAGTGYGTGKTVFALGSTVLASPLTGSALNQFGGNNIVLTGLDVTTTGATGTASRDIRIEAGRSATLGALTAGRTLIAIAGLQSAGNLTIDSGATLQANDDLVLIDANGNILAGATALTVTGTGTDAQAGNDSLAALRADGSVVADPTGSGSIVRLAGSNIIVAAQGSATVGTALATAGASRDIRIAALDTATLATSATASRDVLLLGSIAISGGAAITAGDDAILVARGGNVNAGTITTTGLTASDETLVTDTALDLSGNALGLPGELSLTRLDGSSVVLAASGQIIAPATIGSAGRYTVIGRSGVTLGDVGNAVVQGAARDIVIEASVAPAANVPLADIRLLGSFALTANSDGVGASDGIVFRLGNGSILGAAASVTVGRSALETLANQGSVTSVAAVTNGVKSIVIGTVDAPTADLRALGDAALPELADATVTNAIFDGGFVLVSRTGQASLTDATVSASVPLMTAAELNAVDLKIIGATGAALNTANDGLLRDITVATATGTARIGTASARDDIVLAASAGNAVATTLTLVSGGTDSEVGDATVTAKNADNVALADAYQFVSGASLAPAGTSIANLNGRNIVISGASGASLGTATTVAGANSVRVQTLGGDAVLGAAVDSARLVFSASRINNASISTAVAAEDIAVFAGTNASLGSGVAGHDVLVTGGTASVGTANAGQDIFVQGTGIVTVGSATAGSDITIVSVSGPSVTIGSASAGDDIVVASAGTVGVTGTLTATGSGIDSEAGTDATLARRFSGNAVFNTILGSATINDPAAMARGLTKLTGLTINTLGGSNITVSGGGAVTIGTNAAITTLSAARTVTLLSNTTLAVTGSTVAAAAAGDIIAVAPQGLTMNASGAAPVQSAGRDIFDATTTGPLSITGAFLAAGDIKAGRDIFFETVGAVAEPTGSLSIAANVMAGRDVTVTNTSQAAVLLATAGTVSAGDDIVITSTGAVSTGALISTAAVGQDSESSDAITASRYATGAAIVDPATWAVQAARDTALKTFQTATQLAALGNGPAVTQLAGANIVVAANGAVTVSRPGGAAITAPKRIAILSNAAVTVNGAVTAATGDYTIVAGQIVTLGGVGQTQTSGTRVTVVAPDLALTAALTTSVGNGNRIELLPHDSNGGAALTAVAIGDPAASAAGTFTLSNLELGLLSSPNLEIDALSGVALPTRVVTTFGSATVPATIQNFAVRTTGDIVLNDRLTFTTTSALRTLILGGALVGGTVETGPSDTSARNVFANSVQVVTATGNTAATVKGSIDAAGSTVALRGNFIALGKANGLPATTNDPNAAFNTGLGAAVGTNPLLSQASVRTLYFLNPASTFYRVNPQFIAATATSGPPVVTATGTTTGTLVLATGQWALVQNTGLSTQGAGGIDVQRLQLVKLAGTDPIVGVFGRIAGQGGFVAPVKIALADLGGISPSNVRINGCVALQAASCIITGITQTPIGIQDPARDLPLSINPPSALPFELLIGASNDSLWTDEEYEKLLGPPAPEDAVETPTEKK